MLSKQDRDKFLDHVIAQDDDNDCEENGWVAVVIGDWAALTSYGHCSCYDTWASITGGGAGIEPRHDPKWDWTGTVSDLVKLARETRDPVMPDRAMDEKDCDFDRLMKVYAQIIEWDQRGRANLDTPNKAAGDTIGEAEVKRL